MKFETLLEVANTHIIFPSDTLPLDSYRIATQQLNIVVKNSLQCKIDYKTDNTPLQKNEAIYTLFKGEYTIYYDENHPYKNFFIAHEIAHHLLDHNSDDINKHHDANLLAAIIVAPPHLIKKSSIKSATELSTQCKIPVEVADTYWKEYTNIYLKRKHTNTLKFSILGLYGCVLALSLITILFQINSLKTNQNETIFETHTTEITTEITTIKPTTIYTTENTTIVIPIQEIVYITQYGKKYHKPNCRYVKNKTNNIALTIDDAISMGYNECKICK